MCADWDAMARKDRQALAKAEKEKQAKAEAEAKSRKESVEKFRSQNTSVPRIGGYPYEVKKKGGKTVLRFRPKGEFPKNPDRIIFSITLDDSDSKKLKSLL